MTDYQKESNCTVVQVYEKEIRDELFEKNVEEAERHARRRQLRREARELFDYARMLKQRAEEAQREVSDMTAQANRIAQEALKKHVEGQEKLALAAQKMLEAGVLLQKEASSVNVAEAPYNRHELMDIRQATDAVGQEVHALKQEVNVVRETEMMGELGIGRRRSVPVSTSQPLLDQRYVYRALETARIQEEAQLRKEKKKCRLHDKLEADTPKLLFLKCLPYNGAEEKTEDGKKDEKKDEKKKLLAELIRSEWNRGSGLFHSSGVRRAEKY